MRTKLFSRIAGAAFLIAALSIGGAGEALAQRGPADADAMLNRLRVQLELTEQQAEQLKPMLEVHAQQRAELMQQMRQAGTPMRDNPDFMQMRDRHREQVEAVLTPEQVEKYRTMQRQFENRRGTRPGMRGGQGMRGGGPGAGFDRMADRLNLSEEQRQQMQELVASRVALREQMRASFQNQIGEILTDEQRAEWEAMRSNRPMQGQGRMTPKGRGR